MIDYTGSKACSSVDASDAVGTGEAGQEYLKQVNKEVR